MRWQALFDDLEGQAAAAGRGELEGEVRDRTRRENALVALSDRLAASAGAVLTLTVDGAGALRGRLLDSGPGWLLLEGDRAQDLLVPAAALLALSGVAAWSQAPAGALDRRLDLRWALRGLARDRTGLQVVLRDGSTVSGTLDRVGADHVELAEHAPGEPRRTTSVRGVRLLPLPALAVLRSL